MKKYASKTLKIISMIYICFPLVSVLFSAVLFDIPLNRYVSIFLSPFFYFTSFWAVLAGYGVWELKRWSWYVLLFANLLILYQNAYWVAHYGESHHKFLAYLVSLFVVIALVYRLKIEIKVPYILPSIRWWEDDTRYGISMPVSVTRKNQTLEEGTILDISLGGCFIKLVSELDADEEISICFKVSEQEIQCKGVVVWRTRSTVTHPKGVGVKFNEVSSVDRKKLKFVLKKLRNKSFESKEPVVVADK